MEFKGNHVCWRYEPRSSKGFLPYQSSHSKTIKRSVATTALFSALRKSCHHQVATSFKKQIARLCDSGYPSALLGGVCECISKKLKRKTTSGEETANPPTRCKIAVVPYIHGLTHRLKKIASRQDVQVVCSAPNKAYSMCRRVNKGRDQLRVCNTAHRTQYAPCETGVVYKIPLSCGKFYIGQTGRCINDRAREHAASVKGTSAGHLSAHCRTCGCKAGLTSITVLHRNNNTFAREMLEALAIERVGVDCVSTPSIAVHEIERQYLQCATPR